MPTAAAVLTAYQVPVTWQRSISEETTRALVVLDVDGWKERFNVKNAHTASTRGTIGFFYALDTYEKKVKKMGGKKLSDKNDHF